MTHQQRQFAESKYQESLFNIRSRITHLENSRKFKGGDSPDGHLPARTGAKSQYTGSFLGKLTTLEEDCGDVLQTIQEENFHQRVTPI